MTEISAKIVADSINKQGVRLTTFEIEYPRFILAELNTHRMLSKNTASSRAIPIEKMIEQVQSNPARPYYWGKNQSGMKAKEEIDGVSKSLARLNWDEAAQNVLVFVRHLADLGVHKQTANRLLEPFQWCKTVITGTEWNNFFYLRNHEDAQPEFRILAQKMFKERESSCPILLHTGEWHLPYYRDGFWASECFDESLGDARKISVSCCAQVSYRKQDDSIEKANKIFDMLNVGSKDNPCHASPTEHQATPMRVDETWEDGVTSKDRNNSRWSGNLKEWIQYRQLIPNNYKAG